MKVALYHDLDPGGAYNFVLQTVARSRHDYVWFRVDRGTPTQSDERLAAMVAEVVDHPLSGVIPEIAGRTGGETAQLVRLARLEHRVSRAIAARRLDVALIHPSGRFQAPGLLRAMTTPTVYYLAEPRRASFERGYYGPLVGHRHHPRRAWRYGADRLLGVRDRRSVAAAGIVVTNSVFTAEAVDAVYGRSAEVVRPGVDPTAFPYSAAPREPWVLSVGGLEHAKGHWRVIDALAALDDGRRPEFHVVYGRGAPSLEALLRARADPAGVVIHFHPSVPDDELVGLYQRASATVCAAGREPFGLTTLESISCGTPVVAVRRGGYREVVEDGRTGLLVEPSASALATAIEKAVTGSIGPIDRRTRDRVVAGHSWDAAATQIDDVIVRAGRLPEHDGPPRT